MINAGGPEFNPGSGHTCGLVIGNFDHSLQVLMVSNIRGWTDQACINIL